MVDSPGRVTLWGIEVFVATAEEGSISSAARRLGASPSAVSQQLTNLETALGATLLNRASRPVGLTPAGEIFRRRAHAILNEATQARAELAMGNLSQLTRFHLGMIEDFEADVTPQLLSRMAGELSGCQFLLETGASHMLHDQLDARALDVIVAAEMGVEADWMEVHPILTEGFVVVAARGQISPKADLAQSLKAMAMVQYTTRHHMGRLISAHLARQNLTLSHQFELDSYHAVLSLVADGAGWTILTPLAMMRAQRFADQLDVFDMPFEPLHRTISLTARRGVLQDMPEKVAEQLKSILRDTILPAATRHRPWISRAITLH